MRPVSTKTNQPPEKVNLDESITVAVRMKVRLMAKAAAVVLNCEQRDVIQTALEFYLEKRCPRAWELFKELHGKEAA